LDYETAEYDNTYAESDLTLVDLGKVLLGLLALDLLVGLSALDVGTRGFVLPMDEQV